MTVVNEPVAPVSRSRRAIIGYWTAAYFFGLLSGVNGRFTGAELFGFAFGPMLFWGGIAALVRVFRPTVYVSRWVFWGSLISFGLGGLPK